MTSVADMDILKEIPGYKAIMKAVLKTQIQLLVEQLSDHTGEESIVLTASVNDGSLSHLGSSTGKGFLEGRDEIKSQFLGYCLKSHHKRKTQEEPAPPYQRSNVSHPGPRTALQQSAKRPRLHPVSLTRAQPGSDGSGHLPGDGEDAMFTSTPVRGQRDSSAGPSRSVPSESPSNVKLEQSGILSGEIVQPCDTDLMTPASLPSSIRLSHTQTSAMDKDQSDKDQSDTGDASQDSASIKVEPVTESELDLEITGVEMGDNSSQMSGENWSQIGSGASGDGSFDQSGNQAGYIDPDRTCNGVDIVYQCPPGHTSGIPQPWSYSCCICGQKFLLRNELVQHVCRDHQARHYKCDYCGQMFQKRQNMETHRRIHTGEKPYTCQLCMASFTAMSGLKYHVTKQH